MSQRAIREYGAAIVGSVLGTFLLGAIGYGIVRVVLALLASAVYLGLEAVLPAALLVGLCSWVGAVYGCRMGLKRVNASLVGQTIYVQAGLIVLCYAAAIALQIRSQGQANILIAWVFLIALSALVARGIALWIDRGRIAAER